MKEVQCLVIFVFFVPIIVSGDNLHSNSQLRKRLTGNYDINQYANEDSSGKESDANQNYSNEIEPIADEHTALFETIPGEPKRDYPTYKTIPKTGFSCQGRVNWGYYADVETECQVFHVCESEYSKISFLCPVGSAFNQKHLVCDWWYNFDCHDEISLTSLYDDYDLGREEADGPQDADRDNRSSRGEKTLAKRRGGDYRTEDEEYDNANDNDGIYDLNLVSSGGNV